MKTTQSVLPAATPKKCREEETKNFILGKLTEIFKNGFWFCQDCQSRCERIEGEHGQPDHCDRCRSHRIKWNPPLWSHMVDDRVADTQLIHPHEL